MVVLVVVVLEVEFWEQRPSTRLLQRTHLKVVQCQDDPAHGHRHGSAALGQQLVYLDGILESMNWV